MKCCKCQMKYNSIYSGFLFPFFLFLFSFSFFFLQFPHSLLEEVTVTWDSPLAREDSSQCTPVYFLLFYFSVFICDSLIFFSQYFSVAQTLSSQDFFYDLFTEHSLLFVITVYMDLPGQGFESYDQGSGTPWVDHECDQRRGEDQLKVEKV